MSILIPGKRDKQPKKHRADDRIARLEKHLAEVQADNAKLLNFKVAADDYFALLVDDRNQVYDAWRAEAQKRAEAELVAACTQSELERASLELRELRAYKANAEAITVPPMERDTRAVEDQATGPIDVRPLQEAAAAGLLGPVVRVSTSGASADPGQVRAASWGVDATQPLKTVKGVA